MQKDLVLFKCDKVEVTVTPDEQVMGSLTADHVIRTLKSKHSAGIKSALWLMAAPSAFAFYRELIAGAGQDDTLRDILRSTHFFQFDDYPINRQSPQFEATFRRLLEKHLFEPLAGVCGELTNVHPLELTGTDSDRLIQDKYRDAILSLKEQGVYFIQLKGIGMDGHWGFHGAETPLDMEPAMITVPMNSQNIRQQMLDWPQFFPTAADVPATACTFNVPMFLLADEIIDNVPQASKAFAVLAVYGTDRVINSAPSSAIKRHPRARAFLTRAAAETLLELRLARQVDSHALLNESALGKLRGLWRNPAAPEDEAKNIALMEQTLRQLEVIGG